MNKSTFFQLKYYERPLISIFYIQDNYQADRIKKGQLGLYEIIKKNAQFYKFTDSIVEFTFKCVTRVPMFGEMMVKNQQMIRVIEEWAKNNQHFPINQNRVKIFKQGIVQWNNKTNLVNQQTLERVGNYSKERLNKFQKALKDQSTAEVSYDSDDDMYHHVFEEKEKIDFCDPNDNWYTGYVDIQLDEMVKCVSDLPPSQGSQPMQTWIETESDKLAPSNTQAVSEKRKLYSFYLTLLKNVSS
mmetsp:Transcript_8863/g.8248  ORF Transcript_8863/g.8248 Transcript_8863/m.8248 type:complete len:243 (+) Transcript_8863:7074-7802(+)